MALEGGRRYEAAFPARPEVRGGGPDIGREEERLRGHLARVPAPPGRRPRRLEDGRAPALGGLGVRLLNVTDLLNATKPDDDDDTEAVPYLDAPSVCVSLPRYGSTKGAPGDEAGFVVEMSECVFDPPLRVTHGEAFVVQSVYIADARNHTPAAFPPPYEGVMGYVTLTFTVAPGFEAGVFSRSGERRLLSAETVSENRNGTPSAFGTCVATLRPNAFRTRFVSELNRARGGRRGAPRAGRASRGAPDARGVRPRAAHGVAVRPRRRGGRLARGHHAHLDGHRYCRYSRTSRPDVDGAGRPPSRGHGMPGADMVVASCRRTAARPSRSRRCTRTRTTRRSRAASTATRFPCCDAPVRGDGVLGRDGRAAERHLRASARRAVGYRREHNAGPRDGRGVGIRRVRARAHGVPRAARGDSHGLLELKSCRSRGLRKDDSHCESAAGA